jgi:hypothetical protein
MSNRLKAVTIRIEDEQWRRVVALAREARRAPAELARLMLGDAIAAPHRCGRDSCLRPYLQPPRHLRPRRRIAVNAPVPRRANGTVMKGYTANPSGRPRSRGLSFARSASSHSAGRTALTDSWRTRISALAPTLRLTDRAVCGCAAATAVIPASLASPACTGNNTGRGWTYFDHPAGLVDVTAGALDRRTTWPPSQSRRHRGHRDRQHLLRPDAPTSNPGGSA